MWVPATAAVSAICNWIAVIAKSQSDAAGRRTGSGGGRRRARALWGAPRRRLAELFIREGNAWPWERLARQQCRSALAPTRKRSNGHLMVLYYGLHYTNVPMLAEMIITRQQSARTSLWPCTEKMWCSWPSDRESCVNDITHICNITGNILQWSTYKHPGLCGRGCSQLEFYTAILFLGHPAPSPCHHSHSRP